MPASSIVLGYDKGDWSCTTSEQLRQTQHSVAKARPSELTAKVNLSNKVVNWTCGSERLDYSTSNRHPDPRDRDFQPVRLDK